MGSEVMKGLRTIPAPVGPYKRQFIAPPPSIGAASCDRDYGMSCPLPFKHVGTIGDVEENCAPSMEYGGPCTGLRSFKDLSATAKARWSDSCQAFWPCVVCRRDFSGCPKNWEKGETELSCAPKDSYSGPCSETNFLGFTKAMYESWSSECGAFWPCLEPELDAAPSLYPISMEATVSRIAQSLQ